MTRMLGVVTVAALLGTAVAASAAQATPAKATAQTKAAKATTLVANGKISKFDAASNTLTVSTTQGDQQFMVMSSSRVTDGKKAATAADLGTFTDREARVRYTDSGGQKMVASVQVMPAAKATAAKTTGAKKTPKAKS